MTLRDFCAVTVSLMLSLRHCFYYLSWLLLCLLLYETRVLLSSGNVLLTPDEPSLAPPTENKTPSASLHWPSITTARVTLHWCFGSSLTPIHALSMLKKFSHLEISPPPLCKWEPLRLFLSVKKSNSWFFLCLMCFSVVPHPPYILLLNLQWPRLKHNQGLRLTWRWSMTLSRRFTLSLINTL